MRREPHGLGFWGVERTTKILQGEEQELQYPERKEAHLEPKTCGLEQMSQTLIPETSFERLSVKHSRSPGAVQLFQIHPHTFRVTL